MSLSYPRTLTRGGRSHENHPRWSVHCPRIQRIGFWNSGSVVGVPSRNRSWNSVPVVGSSSFQGSESKNLLELFELADPRYYRDRCVATIFWRYALSLSHTARTAKIRRVFGAVFSDGTIVSRAGRPFYVGVVPDPDVLWRLFARHHSTFHIPGNDLLAARVTFGR